ncbi:hypothetical protein NP493_2771g00000 [Ridgeia piscesae]|uniref:Uncharacterized protein n=1 Tax=Ridgeia piscesae TaxID=27915 RepID=A0AAD9JD80_RIDPI|nr:hypothetical protein NP493_2771g00000 [Ridgeia piscesae]
MQLHLTLTGFKIYISMFAAVCTLHIAKQLFINNFANKNHLFQNVCFFVSFGGQKIMQHSQMAHERNTCMFTYIHTWRIQLSKIKNIYVITLWQYVLLNMCMSPKISAIKKKVRYQIYFTRKQGKFALDQL